MFEDIYFGLVKRYRSFLSDSRTIGLSFKELFIIDSTTIQLFSNILKGAGRNPKGGGKKKGGLKVHTLLDAAGDYARYVWITAAKANDASFLKQLPNLPPESCLVFDKAYNNYEHYSLFTERGISFVTRMRTNAVYEVVAKVFKTSPKKNFAMVLREEHIGLSVKRGKSSEELILRKISYQDASNRRYEFLCNNWSITAEEIALIYEKRWQIEILFKKVKQNFQLRYFYGDTVNAIYIQVWCTLIAQLLMTVLKKQIETKKAYASIISILRLNLQEYYDVREFLKNTRKAVANSPPGPQLRMF